MDTYWKKIKGDFQHQREEVFNKAAHLKHLLVVFQEFDHAATPNKEIMIRYSRKGLRSSIWAQLDAWGWDLDFWEEAVKKAVNVKAKAMIQSSSSICEMDPRCPQENRPTKKKKKDFEKNKYTNLASADTSSRKQLSSTQQTSFPNPKKDQDQQ